MEVPLEEKRARSVLRVFFLAALRAGVANGSQMLFEEFVESFAFPCDQVAVRAIWALGSVVDLADLAGVSPGDLDDWLRQFGHVRCSHSALY